MRRASRGLDIPAGTTGQDVAAEKMFDEFLISIDEKEQESQSCRWAISKGNSARLLSQVESMLRERYTNSLSDSKRIGKIRDKMASYNDELNCVLMCKLMTLSVVPWMI
ncbi:hypothetical protein F443_21198 [Phytophthora nicotianae P1569]|uniref:Uncharacterized protein n=1 Tax=Phytophthora nicotianae P1569 TaxID=1317065 RepID=V9DYJ4_PHYNI|nr:hypothetical protein F443_21198 [Phytophthora nicotianae P1569]